MIRLFLIFLVFTLSACGPNIVSPSSAPSFNQVWRPKSSLSRAQAEKLAWIAARSIGGAAYSVEETHSMEPIIWGNAYLIVEKVSISDIRPGDIILFRRGSLIIVHTCIGNHGGRLTMKGYNNFDGDNQSSQFITQDEVVGRYVGQIVFDPTK